MNFLMSKPPKRIALYPCCGLDFEEPLQLLCDLVDEVVFCDLNPKVKQKHDELRLVLASQNLPESRVLTGDVRQMIDLVNRIDVLFYRCDSNGEGGSGVYVFGKDLFPKIIDRFPSEGALIISDGSNARGNWWRRMKRPNGTIINGRKFHPADKPIRIDLKGNGPVLQIQVLPTDELIT